MQFTHLHVHSQYSILDGATRIPDMLKKAKDDGMKALALTDHGNMFGSKLFYDTARKMGIKPIIGCEAYVARRTRFDKKDKIDRSGHHLIILAKNLKGYQNLMKMASLAFTEGNYYRPRIDKDLIAQNHEGLIISSACLGGEISQKIMSGDIEAAENAALWYKNLLGDDYYLEIMLHPNNDPRLATEVYANQQLCNKEILKIGKKLGIKVIVTNDVHFLNQEDAEAHDILICMNTGKELDDPTRMRYTRQEWFKTTAEMAALFPDNIQELENTMEIADKVEEYKLDSDPIMPVFPIPAEFGSEAEYKLKYSEEELKKEFGEKQYEKISGNDYNKVLRIKFESDYLRHITYQGAAKRWPEGLTDEIKERIDFELNTIKSMGFPGYFLIVHDFIQAARDMGVIVGPGRGSAAGSVVAYCLTITNLDPLKYDLLFERFLNPDRISMPDIDIDFDDDGRQKVLEWVTQKYGQDKVSHIVTFGSMAAKMAIKDVARVLKLPLSEANRLAKLVPDRPKITLAQAYEESDDLKRAKEGSDPMIRKVLKLAETLEGSVRQTGIHACGIIISRDPLSEHIPIMPTEGESLMTTQYDGHFVEPIGLLKMDFLGLRTLSILKKCLENIKRNTGLEIDMDKIPLDDAETYNVFAKGETTGLFQFESVGMKKHLRALQPNRFGDLVAMNALYRPGPMEYIPSFIKRKLGTESICYDHPLMEPYLKDTYGVTVYQEQVMLQSRALGGFTRGQSDALRKAMGKKKLDVMEELKVKFVEGCLANPKFIDGCKEVKKEPQELIDKIWKDWQEFAKYAFNKSHSVCYAYVAYLTGYFKAHYPSEFMAANLSCVLSQIDKVTTLMEECKEMGIEVLSPDVNESQDDFAVNKKGQIRFGMMAIKGVGEGPSNAIIAERNENGPYKDIYDFFRRTNFSKVNKKTIENLISAGGMDSFNINRSSLLAICKNGKPMLEMLISYGQAYQMEQGNKQASLFTDTDEADIPEPVIPDAEAWHDYEKAQREKELLGIYLTAHPLDSYRVELEMLGYTPLSEFKDDPESNESRLYAYKDSEVLVGGMISNLRIGKSKKGNDYAIIKIEDFDASIEIPLFGKDFINYHKFLIQNAFIYIKAKIVKSYKNDNEYVFKIISMGSLEDICKDLVTSFTIQVDVNNISMEEVTTFKQKYLIADKKPEKKQTKPEKMAEASEMLNKMDSNTVNMDVEFFDKINDIQVKTKSIGYKILYSRGFIDFINKSQTITLKNL